MDTKIYNLSPSTISLLIECPRCFWLHIKKGHKRPSGAFPSLPGGMDLKIKEYFDKYRGSLPPEIQGKVRGVLFEDLEILNKWRYWKTSLSFKKENVKVYGAFDDLLVDGDVFIPLDYKTRGSSPKGETLDYYLHQLDIYTLLLNRNGFKTENEAYLIYFYPKKIFEGGIVEFSVEPKKVVSSIKRAMDLIDEAIGILNSDEPPSSHNECVFCNYVNSFSDFD